MDRLTRLHQCRTLRPGFPNAGRPAMNKTTPQKRGRTAPAAPPIHVPAPLAGLLMLGEEEHAADASRALAVARTARADPLRRDVYTGVNDFVTSEAARGAWKDLHQAIERLARPEDS